MPLGVPPINLLLQKIELHANCKHHASQKMVLPERMHPEFRYPPEFQSSEGRPYLVGLCSAC